MQKDGSVRSIGIVQQDEEQESHAGDIELLWMYTSEQVENDDWFEGQLEVQAHAFEDIPQNYSVGIKNLKIKAFRIYLFS